MGSFRGDKFLDSMNQLCNEYIEEIKRDKNVMRDKRNKIIDAIKECLFLKELENGRQRLYLIAGNEPIYYTNKETGKQEYTFFFVTSYNITEYKLPPLPGSSGVTMAFKQEPETFIFPANEEGKVLSFGELHGSFKGEHNHDVAVRRAGYVVKN